MLIGPFAARGQAKDGFDFAYPPEQEIDFSKQYDGHAWKRELGLMVTGTHDIDLPNYSSLYFSPHGRCPVANEADCLRRLRRPGESLVERRTIAHRHASVQRHGRRAAADPRREPVAS